MHVKLKVSFKPRKPIEISSLKPSLILTCILYNDLKEYTTNFFDMILILTQF